MSTDPDPADQATLGGHGDAVDMAAKVPTLSGFLVALAAGAFVWIWHRLSVRSRAARDSCSR
jgi:hypothetical protein